MQLLLRAAPSKSTAANRRDRWIERLQRAQLRIALGTGDHHGVVTMVGGGSSRLVEVVQLG